MAKLSQKSPTSRLLEVIHLERQDIYLLITLTFGYGVLGIATPVAVQALVNIVTMGGVLQPLYVVSIMLFFLLVLSGALYLFEAYIVELIKRRMYVRAALEAGLSIQGMQAQMYDANNPVELMNRFFDITTAQKSISTLLTVALAAVLQGIVGSIILMFYSIYFLIIVVLMIAMLAVIVFLLGRAALPTALEESNVKYETAAWLETIARNNYLFKFFNAKERVAKTTDDYAKEYLEKRKAHFKILFLQNLGGVTLYATVGTLMLVLGGALVIQGQINLGQFVAAELIIFGVLAAFVRFINKLEAYYDLLVAFEKLGVLQDIPQESVGSHLPKHDHYNHLEVHELSFAYTPRIAPIQGLSFNLKKGESLAILGTSGTGKSTLIALLTGLRNPNKGYISAEGVDLRQLDLTNYRNRIGMVTKVEFMEGTILENLTLGRDDISIDAVHQVLTELNLEQDIANLEFGLDTSLTAFGAPLSSTQAQRMMLARAIIGNPDMMIIDGLLDNLNQEELNAVLRLLKQKNQQWMLIITTRREEIARQFDQVITLGKRVKEQP